MRPEIITALQIALESMGSDYSASETMTVTSGEPQDCLLNGSGGSSVSNGRVIRVFKIFRLLRIARIMRLVKFIACVFPILPVPQAHVAQATAGTSRDRVLSKCSREADWLSTIVQDCPGLRRHVLWYPHLQDRSADTVHSARRTHSRLRLLPRQGGVCPRQRRDGLLPSYRCGPAGKQRAQSCSVATRCHCLLVCRCRNSRSFVRESVRANNQTPDRMIRPSLQKFSTNNACGAELDSLRNLTKVSRMMATAGSVSNLREPSRPLSF